MLLLKKAVLVSHGGIDGFVISDYFTYSKTCLNRPRKKKTKNRVSRPIVPLKHRQNKSLNGKL